MLLIVVLALLVFDRKRLLAADFLLLGTFAAFFIFAGNLARVEAVDALLRSLLLGREYLTALLLSQVISNVPAALLLSGFTENVRGLLLGAGVTAGTGSSVGAGASVSCGASVGAGEASGSSSARAPACRGAEKSA